MNSKDKQYFQGFSITTGVVSYRDLGWLLATKDDLVADDIPHTRIYQLDRGSWGGWDLNWTAGSATICHLPERRFLALGDIGVVKVIGGGRETEEEIGSGDSSPRTRGPLREVRSIAAGKAYAVGTCRQAYRRDAPGVWTCIDQTAQAPVEDITDTSFESIDGFSETDIYTVGWEGEIWHYNGQQWNEIESPTNLSLYKVLCAGDGYVYACGQVGTLMQGRGPEWKIIAQDNTHEDLWGLEWFNNRLYLSSTHLLYELDGDELQLVDFGSEPPPATCYHLSAADGIMWSIGAKDVMEFDGQVWSTVLKI
jgi:hypothetical protein